MISKFDIIMYLETLFKKNIKNITKEELLKVNSITLELRKIEEKDTFNLYDIMQMFPNIKKINLKNGNIDREILNTLSIGKLESLGIINCGIPNDVSFQKLSYLKELTIIDSAVLNFEFLKTLNNSLKKLSIINPLDETFIDISKLTKYSELNSLYLEKCVIVNIDKLAAFPRLNSLSLLWSEVNNIDDSNVFYKISSLTELYISDCYCTPDLLKKIPQSVNIYKNWNHVTLEEVSKSL